MINQLIFPATSRNRHPIKNVLSEILPKTGSILEIGSGSGEHAVFFQKSFPNLVWQTSEVNQNYKKSISAWIKAEGLENKMPSPIHVDISNENWRLDKKIKEDLNSIITINVLHITKWECTIGLIKGSSKNMKAGGKLIIYGPFMKDGLHNSITNNLFDKQLRLQNEEWGVRDILEVNRLAVNFGFSKCRIYEMPANNNILMYKKVA